MVPHTFLAASLQWNAENTRSISSQTLHLHPAARQSESGASHILGLNNVAAQHLKITPRPPSSPGTLTTATSERSSLSPLILETQAILPAVWLPGLCRFFRFLRDPTVKQ